MRTAMSFTCDCRQSTRAAGRASSLPALCDFPLDHSWHAQQLTPAPACAFSPCPQVSAPKTKFLGNSVEVYPIGELTGRGKKLGSVQHLQPGNAPPEQCGAWAASARQRQQQASAREPSPAALHALHSQAAPASS